MTNDFYLDIGTVIGDMHGHSGTDVLRDGIKCISLRPYDIVWTGPFMPHGFTLHAISFNHLPGKGLCKFIEENTGKPYSNKLLVVIGIGHDDSIITAYSYDGDRGGIITFALKNEQQTEPIES